jgi:hypothetical protein
MTEPLLVLDDQELELDRQQHPEVAHIANTNSESQPPSRPAHTISQSECNPSDSQGQRQDLFDTFQLFKTYLDHKSVDFKSDILSAQPPAELSAIRINLLRSLNLVIKSIAT